LSVPSSILTVFQVVEITPPALQNIGYKTYIIFAVLNIITAIVCFTFYPETSYLTLESVDELFLPDAAANDAEIPKRWYSRFQWAIIPRARAAVKKAKADRKLEKKAAAGDTELIASSPIKESKVAGMTEHHEL
jgi:hypothetical protein